MLLRIIKKENLNVKDLPVNKEFWKTVKPYFSNKGLNSNKMIFKEKGELVSDKKQLASIMNTLFIITKSLKLIEDEGSPSVTLNDILKKIFFLRVLTRLENL